MSELKKEPKAVSCATLWEKQCCPSEEVFSIAADMTLSPDEKIPMRDDLFRKVDHICQACEVYESMKGV